MTDRIIWYHGDWSQPAVMKDAPHPEDWNIGHWSFNEMAKFISARNREVRQLVKPLRRQDPSCGYERYRGPYGEEHLTAIHTSVMDPGHCGIALLSTRAPAPGVTEVVVVIPKTRRRDCGPSHIARQVKFAPLEWREKMMKLLWKHRNEGDTLAFTSPVAGSDVHAPNSVLHDYQRALIRAMLAWLKEKDASRVRAA